MDWIGRHIGGYRIESIIGRGGMATVYRAYQTKLERWVAIKVIHLPGENAAGFLKSFKQEAKALAALHHPNILNIYDYGEEDGLAYLVSEFVPGGTMAKLMKGRPISWQEASRLILPIGRALAYAHAKDIVHCDIKPANILLPQPDWPILADFGLLKLRGVYEPGDLGLMSGTADYISPEQMTGVDIGPRSDIYSLGMLLFEMLTGRLPFTPIAAGGTIQRLSEQAPAPSKYNDKILPVVEDVILKALELDPGRRFSSMQSMVNRLQNIQWSGAPGAVEAMGVDNAGSTSALSAHPDVRGPHLIVTGTETVLPLSPNSKKYVLGRGDAKDKEQPELNLDPHGGNEAGVSRRHALIIHTAKGWMLSDLNSTNGTSLNMSRIMPDELHQLNSGDVIRCGRLMLVFYEQ